MSIELLQRWLGLLHSVIVEVGGGILLILTIVRIARRDIREMKKRPKLKKKDESKQLPKAKNRNKVEKSEER